MEILLSIRAKSDSSTREVKAAIDNGLVVGRGAEHGVVLDGPDLSREHLVITADATDLFIADLSSNGTWLNGTRLQRSAKARIQAGDLIEIPGYALSFKPAKQPGEHEEAIEKPAPPLADVRHFPAASIGKKPRFLHPVLGFVGSFTFLEKILVLLGLSGLALLFTYAAS
jgi:pSer/pThr/pTyr-binding forkhead associated (FHA) protein